MLFSRPKYRCLYGPLVQQEVCNTCVGQWVKGHPWQLRLKTVGEHLSDKKHFVVVALRPRPPFTGVPKGPGRKVARGVRFECSWAPGSKCPKECFLTDFWHSWGCTQKSLSGALRARCPKALKKHSAGHFPARPPGHSCKWRPGSQL